MRPINILVAEDNPLNFELLQDLLESLGHRICWARDGQEALSLARSGGFDLLFLDLHMPRLNGLEVMVGLRGDPVRGHLKVIALTADAMPAVRAELLRAGVDGFLHKPLNLGLLVDQMETAMNDDAGPTVSSPGPALVRLPGSTAA